MHTPSAALAWELWRRHRPRLIALAAVVLGFVLFYPTLCARVGFDPGNSDALDEIPKKLPLSAVNGGPTPLMIVRLLYFGFLACGPAVAMVICLLFVTWIFTFAEMDPRTKDPLSFPARLFTLPISTSFLFGWLLLAGMGSIVALCEIWIHCVRMPHVEVFASYQHVFAWMTLLALVQGIAWALGGWPTTRMFTISGVFLCFFFSPGWRDVLASPIFLTPFFLLGLALAGSGLHKMRHGQWQGWPWQWPFASNTARAELGGPPQFASPARAQLWFEWRRFARRMCCFVAGLTLVPVALHLLVRGIFGLGPLQDNTIAVFVVYLLAIPVMLHFCFALAPPRGDLPFQMNRPLTNGEMMTATVRATGISTLISWGVVLASLCAMPWLGDFRALLMNFSHYPQDWAILILGLTLLTWRSIPASLGFVLSGNKRLSEMPVWMFLGLIVIWIAFIWLDANFYWDAFWRFVPAIMIALIAAKISLAVVAFRLCLKRRLLTPSALAGYLAFWAVLVTVLIAALLLLAGSRLTDVFPSCLAIILLVPLARIGFCPIALAWNRHA